MPLTLPEEVQQGTTSPSAAHQQAGPAPAPCPAAAAAALLHRDAMNFRTGSLEYMAPEMLDKPTAAEVFHLVRVLVGGGQGRGASTH